MSSLLYILNIVFLAVTLLQRIVILAQNLMDLYHARKAAPVPAAV